MNAQILELIYKGIISLAVGLLLYFLKGFRTDVKELTKGLQDVSLGLNTLITKDTHKEEAITDLKHDVARSEKDIVSLKIRVTVLEQHKKTGE